MPDFQKLFAEVLRQKPQLTEEVLRRMIDEKKEKVGGGYLTDQGSLFLIAAELGVSLENIAKSALKLKDAYIGANDISLACRILAVYPTRNYSRKRDNSEGKYRKLVVYDKDSYLKVTLWEESCDLIEKLELKVGEAIRLVGGYVKSGLDGRPVVNIGNRGTIQLVDRDKSEITAGTGGEYSYERIPEIGSKVLRISQVSTPAQYLCLVARVKGLPKTSEFTRKDGAKGRVTQILISDTIRETSGRLVLWNYEKKLEFKENQLVRIYNARAKVLSHGEVEFHGDESTEILAIEEKPALITLRLLNRVATSDYCSCLGIDKDLNFYSIYVSGAAAKKISETEVGKVVLCKPARLSDSRIFLQRESEIEFLSSSQEEIINLPTEEQFRVKVEGLTKIPKVVFIEVMALSNPVVQDVGTRDGLIVKRGEVTVGDETGETHLSGWRNQADMISQIHTGEKLSLRAVEVQNRDGRLSLVLRPYSSISKILTST